MFIVKDDLKRLVSYKCANCGNEEVILHLLDVAYADRRCPVCGKYILGLSEPVDNPDGSIVVWNEEKKTIDDEIAEGLLRRLRYTTMLDEMKKRGIVVGREEYAGTHSTDLLS